MMGIARSDEALEAFNIFVKDVRGKLRRGQLRLDSFECTYPVEERPFRECDIIREKIHTGDVYVMMKFVSRR